MSTAEFESTSQIQIKENKNQVEMRGVEPRTFHMRSERSTTELHPLHDSTHHFSVS